MASTYLNVSIDRQSRAAISSHARKRPAGLNENRLVAAVKRGQTARFDELWRPHAERILRLTYRITRNREDAEDALQDSLLTAFAHIKQFDGSSSFSAWLTRIAFHSALTIVRNKNLRFEVFIHDCHASNSNVGLEA